MSAQYTQPQRRIWVKPHEWDRERTLEMRSNGLNAATTVVVGGARKAVVLVSSRDMEPGENCALSHVRNQVPVCGTGSGDWLEVEVGPTGCVTSPGALRPPSIVNNSNRLGQLEKSSGLRYAPKTGIKRPAPVQQGFGNGSVMTSEQLDKFIEDVLTLEQHLGPNNLQVGKSFLFLSRLLHSLGTPPALRMAQTTLQRAYEVMVFWRLQTHGTSDVPCPESFQYLFNRIQQKLESQQQASIDVNVVDLETKKMKIEPMDG